MTTRLESARSMSVSPKVFRPSLFTRASSSETDQQLSRKRVTDVIAAISEVPQDYRTTGYTFNRTGNCSCHAKQTAATICAFCQNLPNTLSRRGPGRGIQSTSNAAPCKHNVTADEWRCSSPHPTRYAPPRLLRRRLLGFPPAEERFLWAPFFGAVICFFAFFFRFAFSRLAAAFFLFDFLRGCLPAFFADGLLLWVGGCRFFV